MGNSSIDIVMPTTGEVVPFSRDRLGGGQAHRTALDLPDDLAFEEWAAIGDALSAAEQSVMWWIGDWWAYGDRQGYGERSAALQELRGAGHNPPSLGTCRVAGVVARRFKPLSRRNALSWGHHAAVASLDDGEADWFLDRSETNNWTRAQLREEVRRHKLAALKRPGERKYDTQTTDDLLALIHAGKRFGTIYADPPWPYDNQATRGATTPSPSKGDRKDRHDKFHYANMSIDEICDLPVSRLTGEAAHCHLWTTNGFLRQAFDVMAAWGFTYKSCFVWVKPDLGIGNYWRVGHEFMLFGIKGKAPFRDNSQQSWVYEGNGEHSVKPAKVRRIVEKVSPGPWLELFGRREVENWTVWGNEIERIREPLSLNLSGVSQ